MPPVCPGSAGRALRRPARRLVAPVVLTGRRVSAELRLARSAEAVALVDFREQELATPRKIDDMIYAIEYSSY